MFVKDHRYFYDLMDLAALDEVVADNFIVATTDEQISVDLSGGRACIDYRPGNARIESVARRIKSQLFSRRPRALLKHPVMFFLSFIAAFALMGLAVHVVLVYDPPLWWSRAISIPFWAMIFAGIKFFEQYTSSRLVRVHLFLPVTGESRAADNNLFALLIKRVHDVVLWIVAVGFAQSTLAKRSPDPFC